MEIVPNSNSVDHLFEKTVEVPLDRLQYPRSDANSSSDNHRNIEGGSSSDGLDMIMASS